MEELLTDLLNQAEVESNSITQNFYAKSEIKSRDDGQEKLNDQNLSSNVKTEVETLGIYDTRQESMLIMQQGWLKIASELYSKSDYYPPINLEDGTVLNISVDYSGYLKNPSTHLMEYKLPNDLYFYFRLSKTNLYYTISKSELHILSATNVRAIKSIDAFHDYSDDGMCFQLKDRERKNWKLCALNIKEKNEWICAISKLIGVHSRRCPQAEKVMNITEVKITTNENMIVIPYPSRNCNDDWDYFQYGNDWECVCSEGKEQSPIDLPDPKDAIQTNIKPLFQYNHIKANSTETSLDKMIVQGEFIKIRYKENILRILHPNLGRVITFDGTIYQAEEVQFHTPGEHTINGRKFDMEMQVIHYGITKGDIGKQFVLCFLFRAKAGIYNKFISDIDFFNLPNELNPEGDITNDLYIPKVFYSVDDLNNDDKVEYIKPFSMYTYQGSLTSPPCVENTIVAVVDEVLKVSITTLNLFKEAIGKIDKRDSQGNFHLEIQHKDNNRKIQNRNGRPVFYFNCGISCEVNKNKVREKPTGHYEKVNLKAKQFFLVSGSEPSGLPNSFVVNEDEVYDKFNPPF